MKIPILINPETHFILPDDERRLTRQVANGGCLYDIASAVMSPPEDPSDERLASEYLRVLVLRSPEEARMFEEAHRTQMNKKTSKTPELKKAFTDAISCVQRISGIRIGGTPIGQIAASPLPRKTYDLKGGRAFRSVRIATPDVFDPNGTAYCIVFATDLDYRVNDEWYSRFLGEAYLAMEAYGRKKMVLVGVCGGEHPCVKAVRLIDGRWMDVYCRQFDVFGEQVSTGLVEGCGLSTCGRCCDAIVDVLPTEPSILPMPAVAE